MNIAINMLGYEIAVAVSKKKPGPAVLVSNGYNFNVEDVSEVLHYMAARGA